MKIRKVHFLSLAILICISQHSVAQNNSSAKDSRKIVASETYGNQLYSGMKWRSIGPYQGGRSLTATGVVGAPLTYYMGATGGGVWKTIDGGIT